MGLLWVIVPGAAASFATAPVAAAPMAAAPMAAAPAAVASVVAPPFDATQMLLLWLCLCL
jgi:hypothetical protein